MGSNQSSSNKSLTDIMMENSTNYVSQNTTQQSASNINTNDLTINILPGTTVNGDCYTSSDQSITSDQKATVVAKIQNVEELKNSLKGIVDNTLSQQQTSVNGFMATAFGNQKSSTEIQNNLHTIIDTNVTNENVITCNAILDNLNKKILNLGGPNSTLNCGPGEHIGTVQSIVSTQVAQCYADVLTKALMSNSNIADAVNKADIAQSSKNEGFSLANLLGFGMDPTTMFYVAIFILIILFAYKFIGGSSNLNQILPPQFSQILPPQSQPNMESYQPIYNEYQHQELPANMIPFSMGPQI